MGLLDRFRRREPERADPNISIDQWASYFSYNGVGYQLNPSAQFMMGQKEEPPWPSYEGFALSMAKANSIVYTCMEARKALFSQARFQYRHLIEGRPADLWGNKSLRILENPWQGGTTQDLLAWMISDVDIAGNFYAVYERGSLFRLRPDWMTIVLGSRSDPDTPAFAHDCEVVGYSYQPGGPARRRDPIPFRPEQVVHWAPTKDPLARFRGMSWLTPIVREVMSDSSATTHKLKFFENGATPNLAITLPLEVQLEAFNKWVEAFEKKFGEADGMAALNAYKTLMLGAGADVQVIGANMRQIDFKLTQGAGETRIAAAARVPAVIAQISEGLQGSSLNEGNYQIAMRQFVDLTMCPLWQSAAGALSTVVVPPSGSILWYDDTDIPALSNNAKDTAEIQRTVSDSLHTLIIAGFNPEDAVAAIQADDLSKLEHSGLFSVQLQPAAKIGEGKGALVGGVPEPANGTAPAAEAAAILAAYLKREAELEGRTE